MAGCSTAKVLSSAPLVTGFDQTPLPYAYPALEPVIDALTMEIHYSKHASAYAKNAKDAALAEKVDTNKPIEEVLASVSKYSMKMRNNAGGHYNHELFWKCMKANGGVLAPGKLKEAITQSFGSMEAFQTQFGDAGKNRFGSGWAWLYATKDKQLKVGSTPNQDNPLMDISDIKGTPLLGLDVWEHAYYLKYQNRRADYVTAWWKAVNWDFVSMRFETL
ncbi:MAG: superoxide dismutase [Chitinophagaceae bacterium]|nr:superoxide dismutase [Chitinophagaceae bacterium]